jgi:group I intron endonuclease
MVVQGIYQIRNKVNGHSYIGSSTHILRRWSGHRFRLRRGDHPNCILQRAWTKYGEESFELLILEEVADKNLLRTREAHHMLVLGKEYNISRPNEETNKFEHSPDTLLLLSQLAKERGISDFMRQRQRETNTGRPRPLWVRQKIAATHTGMRLSDETKQKISQALTGRPGPQHSEETRAKISAANKGRKWSAEARARISIQRKGRLLTEEHRARIAAAQVGRTHSEETLARMSKAQKGHPVSEETRAKVSATRIAKFAAIRAEEAARHPGMQVCRDCQAIKPTEEFRWKSKARGVRLSRCKPCDKQFRDERRTKALSE